MFEPRQSALILFAHGARDPDWALTIYRVRDSVRAARPEALVQVAFLEFMTPDLDTAADALVGEGASRVTVVPLFIAQGGHLKKELPVMLDALRSRYPDVSFELTPPVGEFDMVVAAMACQAKLSAGL